jgi:dephospho-CoA kinase
MPDGKHVVIAMAGASAAGKTTTTWAFAEGPPDEHKDKVLFQQQKGPKVQTVKWTFYENCGLAGNHACGSDCNIGPQVIKHAMYKVLEKRDIVIVDGKLSSPQWPIMCNEWPGDLTVILLWFKLPPEIILERLSKRRDEPIEATRELQWSKCKQGRRRAELLVEHFLDTCEREMRYIVVDETWGTEDIVYRLDNEICVIFGDCED